ncbi:hypothetical protein EJP77_12240 [Paenibacillus zeisoli]|uniref:Uncharacterized protein n=1 Tax=Paenibacillus zeisoli TaxID=2496267 RepID=A0A3S1D8V4_9BACL|nr:hypothetical protein [Paenibacillus zeisoli]RUT30590.1 hypothetical protein EJP77_12240 [Paenibacillus zeisoli]
MKGKILLIYMLIGTILVGCNHDNQSNREPLIKQVKSFYPKDISTLDRLEILRSDGERKKVENKERIIRWLDQIGKLDVNVDTNLEDHSGSLFIVNLSEGDNKMFFLTPTSINGTRISPNQDLADLMLQFWDEQK